MTVPSSPAARHENDEPIFEAVIDELGYDPAYPESPAGDAENADEGDDEGDRDPRS